MNDSGDFLDDRNFNEPIRVNSAEVTFTYSDLIGLDNVELAGTSATRGSARNRLLRMSREQGEALRNTIVRDLYADYQESLSL